MSKAKRYMENLQNGGFVGKVSIYTDASSLLQVLAQFRPTGPVAVGSRGPGGPIPISMSPVSASEPGKGVVVIAVTSEVETDQPV